jgi:S1-C subfamily serine protease
MRVQVVAAFIIAVQAVILNATDWSAVVVGLEQSVPRIEILAPDAPGPGTCSGVVLNAEAGYVLTAAHCTVEKAAYTVNGRHAELVRQNRILDLAVLRTELKDAKAMPLAKDPPSIGAEVALVGFAFGAKRLHHQFGRVSQPFDDDGAMILDLMVIAGESGGPAINAAGELIGLTSAVKFAHPTMHAALLIPVSKVREFVENYLPKQP